jgi:hypothetical protein
MLRCISKSLEFDYRQLKQNNCYGVCSRCAMFEVLYTVRTTKEETGTFIEGRVARFSATTVPFPASESAVVRGFPHVSFFTCTHKNIVKR